ncbi:hypothetical protein KO561_05145 [Radiobacillus kanasensis]|uniref:hypothetical protein n=1 Tax=Radiobacillus kanasensis TaxID=2844358 RepID=UPI001E464DD6|nr:hypothetical protein [Radiobacillus kanasensis]UFU00338.1 hypothetical protein KO561_05145 [Radiobacillus kanasensis]
MSVDDHAIERLKVWFELEYDELKAEWKSNEYSKLSDCPSFKSTTAYRESLNVLIKACYLPDYVDEFKIRPLKKMIDEDLLWENFSTRRD